jgi:hypothetical protein
MYTLIINIKTSIDDIILANNPSLNKSRFINILEFPESVYVFQSKFIVFHHPLYIASKIVQGTFINIIAINAYQS